MGFPSQGGVYLAPSSVVIPAHAGIQGLCLSSLLFAFSYLRGEGMKDRITLNLIGSGFRLSPE